MRLHLFRSTLAVIALTLLLSFSCKKEEAGGAITGISIDPQNLTLSQGDTYQLKAVARDGSGKSGNGDYTPYEESYPLCPDNNYSTGWFLPSGEEWQLCIGSFGLDNLNTILSSVASWDTIPTGVSYWTPRQYDKNNQYYWLSDTGQGVISYQDKYKLARTRAFMAL